MSNQSSVEQTLAQAATHHLAEEWQAAEWLYLAILQADPLHPDANHNLGVMSVQLGKPSEALPLLRTALLENPAERQYWISYIEALLADNQRDEAKSVLNEGISRGLDGPLVESLQYRVEQESPGATELAGVQNHEPETSLSKNNGAPRAIQARAKNKQKNNNSLVANATPSHLRGLLRQALRQLQSGRLPEAITTYRRILDADPQNPTALNNLGYALLAQGNREDALVSFQHAIVAKPDYASAHNNLGNTLSALGRLGEAVVSYDRALAIDPGYADALVNLANVLKSLGRPDEAIATYQRALSLKPDYAETYTHMLLTMQYSPSLTPSEIFLEHRRFAERFEAPLKPSWRPHYNDRNPDRKIRVGYVSGDFFNHSVAFFIEPILACHDKSKIEIYCYHNATTYDNYTKRINSCADHWLAVSAMSDEELAKRIRNDEIDILVDLSGHTPRNRLLVFARKPAPVQVTWIGYAGTTGLTGINYRITDAYMDPPGLTERYHSEELFRLPATGAAYRPYPGAPAVSKLPALTTKEFVFACLNNLAKLNPSVANLWGKILSAVPNGRLMLGNVTDAGVRRRLVAMFLDAGIAEERLILLPQMSLDDYFKRHQQIDLALDPFPYNGGTTTLHSMWMGVPVITLSGEHTVSRVGATLLSRVGLSDFITQSDEAYLNQAVQLAGDLPRLDTIRQSLRERMTTTDCDPVIVTRHLEEGFRQMWRKWCTT